MTSKFPSAPELVVITKPAAGLRARGGDSRTLESVAGADVSTLTKILKNTAMTPLFGPSEERILASAAEHTASTGVSLPDLSVFYRIEAPGEKAADLLAKLIGHEAVEAAYIKPGAEPAQLNDMVAQAFDAPPTTPNFTASQIYLGAAPGGIEALWAHTRPGGKGDNVRIIDIEGAWRFSHEDLGTNQGGVVGGVMSSDLGWRNHGTAVAGEISGDENSFGILGIAPNANIRAISIFLNPAGTSANSSKAIKDAADKLSAGDIILLELHRPGPRFAFANRADQAGYIAVEWWEDDFQAILYATSKGVIVVEAAGNGQENLDDVLYNTRPAGFPASWTNPFNRAHRDSGAIVVGAGAPPPGTHGRDHGPDRSRLGFSNYGALIDAQGWGREVTTTGYGDLQGGANEDLWYTETFSGTSSASPIVVGAIASMQGARKAGGSAAYTPANARQKLRATGSGQQDAPGRPATQRIGNRPNLRSLIGGVIKIKDIKDHGKDVIKDKEFKEKVEKIEKIEIKEIKREKIEKIEKIEIKEIKPEFEKIRDLGGKLNEVIGQIGGGGNVINPAGSSIEERLAAIEAAIGMTAQLEEDQSPAPLPQAMICTAFGGMLPGPRPNPFIGNGASFKVFLPGNVPAPATNIQAISGLTGLNCVVHTEAHLAQPASSVVLALANFSVTAVQIKALNAANVVVASAIAAPLSGLGSFILNGPGITRVIINCPLDRTLLVRFCYRRIFKIKPEKEAKIEKHEKIEKQEKEKDKNDTKDQKDFHKEVKEVNENPKPLKEVAKDHKEAVKEIKETGKDHKDHKEHKEHKEKEKEVAKDTKESKDAKEQKEHKEHKDSVKEHKDGFKEHKDATKDHKDFKEFAKEKDGHKELEIAGFQTQEEPSTEDRLAATEAAFGHFIGAALRPDLSGGALTGEEDLCSQSSDLDKESADAKGAKDSKDSWEKLAEG